MTLKTDTPDSPLLKVAATPPAPVPPAAPTIQLADGPHELRFTVKALIRVENAFDTHQTFLDDLAGRPVSTLGAVLILTEIAKDEPNAIALLEGVDRQVLREQVLTAWRTATFEPEPAEETGGV